MGGKDGRDSDSIRGFEAVSIDWGECVDGAGVGERRGS